MIPEISTIFWLIGIIAGMTFYLDGWRPSGNGKLSASQRYRGLIVVVGGGVVSSVIDSSVVETDQYDCFKGYLFGVVFGWFTLFIGITLLYVFWKNTEDSSPDTNLYKIGQVCYTLIEVINEGITVIKPQQEIAQQIHENELEKLKKKLKKEDPQGYVQLEEQIIRNQQYSLENQKKNFESLKRAVGQAHSEPEQEAENLIQDKNKLIQTLQDELELARSGYDKDSKRIQEIVAEYTGKLRQQEDEIRELRQLINDFRDKTISRSEFSRLISFKRINQYEFGGLFIGELDIQGKLIKIYQGDITNLVTDVIVSSDDNYLTMGGGVSHRISSVGGNDIHTEAKKLLPLSLGEVAVTTAGKLSAQKIFHGVVIDFDTRRGPSREVIQQVIHTCIEKANEANYRSIAFPLLGTGAGRFSAIEALRVLLSQVIKDLSHQPQSLAEVIIVIYGRVAQVIDVEAIIKDNVNSNYLGTPSQQLDKD